jgi:MFS family permease
MIRLICDRETITVPKSIISMLLKDLRSRQQSQVHKKLENCTINLFTFDTIILVIEKNDLFLLSIGAIGAFVLGNIIGWNSPVQPQLQQNSTEIIDENSYYWIAHIYLDDNQMSWVGSLPNLGALVGALSGGFFMDKFGRRLILMIISVPYLVAWILLATAANPGELFICL